MAKPQVESIYPLSPLQEGMLFHSTYHEDVDPYIVQLVYKLNGDLDVAAWRRAWQAVLQRHAALRTGFSWKDRNQPLQIVRKQVELPLEASDWRELSSKDQQERLEVFLKEDRLRRFDLSKAPLMRFHLFRNADNQHHWVWTLHHLVADRRTVLLAFQEARSFYEAFSESRDLHLPPPRPYKEYIAWLQRQDLKKAEIFWRRTLEGFGAPTPLAIDRALVAPAGEENSILTKEEYFSLTVEASRALQAMARDTRITVNTLVQGAWALLLSRYSDENDVVFGTTVFGRPPELNGAENMVGMFLNTLAIRAKISPEMPVIQWLRKFQMEQVEARQYDYAPVFLVQGWSELARRTPLFDSLVVFENDPAERLARQRRSDAIEISQVDGFETNTYPLSLTASHGDRLGVRVTYHIRRFETDAIKRMIGHYERLLEGIVSDADRKISQLEMLTEQELQQIVVDWNATKTEYPQDLCMHEIFEREVKEGGERVALVFEDQDMTYAELNRRANKLAHFLRKLGVGPEVRVAILIERSPQMVIALLGIMKSGGAYVPLDPTYPTERLTYMVEDSGAKVLVTQESFLEKIPGVTTANVVCLERESQSIDRQTESNPDKLAGSENLAYIYYTSGSTGRPKGVAVPHCGIVNYIEWGVDAYHAREGNGAAVHTSIAVDLTLANFLPLFAGKPVHLIPEKEGVEGLVTLIQRKPELGLLKITPTHLAVLNPRLKPREMESATRLLVIGADNLVAEPTLVWRDQAAGVKLLNEYGPTETVVGCSIYEIGEATTRVGGIPIGKPIANIRMYVLDPEMRPKPVGVAGELFIGGIGLARGYWARPDLTAEKFVPDPFSNQPGERLYRTGDRARYQQDGNLEFLGRLDFQVKIRGYRIEIGEIEGVLSNHHSVKKVMVVVKDLEQGDKRLVAYVGVGNSQVTVKELREYLRDRVPEYMVPGSFVTMEELPVGATGKIDPKALPPVEMERSEFVAGYVPPADPMELQLAQIWEDVLETRPIGTTDNFFDLGGHSMLAVRLLSRIKERFQVDVPLVTLVRGGTISDAAAALRRQLESAPQPVSVLVPIQPAGGKAPLFCIHPAGGGVLNYVNLARHLGFDQPVYGLQDPLFPENKLSVMPIESFAEMYVEAISRFRPHGPYHLVGWSFGGVIAFEMAQQFRRKGELVALLGMFDTASSISSRVFVDNDESNCKILAGLARERAIFMGKDLFLSAEELIELEVQDRWKCTLERLRAVDAVPPELTTEAIEHMLDRWWTRIKTLQEYKPEIYPGPITVFSALETDPEAVRDWPDLMAVIHREPSLGWAELSSMPVDIYDVPGYHATIGSEPHVQVLAERVTECLSRPASSVVKSRATEVVGTN